MPGLRIKEARKKRNTKLLEDKGLRRFLRTEQRLLASSLRSANASILKRIPMVYRNWTITTYSTFLGYQVQFTSPIGQAHYTSPCFPTDEDAVAYARTRIDHFLNRVQPHFAVETVLPGSSGVDLIGEVVPSRLEWVI
jgi:hypothetical protein